MRENEEIYRRFIETVWNEREFDSIGDFVADDCVFHDTSTPEPIHGPGGMKEYFEVYDTAFPDAHIEIDQVLATDDWVVARWTATGTHEGSLLGIEPTGEEMTVSGMEIDRIEDGKIVEGWQITDTFGMLQQIGVVEPLAE